MGTAESFEDIIARAGLDESRVEREAQANVDAEAIQLLANDGALAAARVQADATIKAAHIQANAIREAGRNEAREIRSAAERQASAVKTAAALAFVAALIGAAAMLTAAYKPFANSGGYHNVASSLDRVELLGGGNVRISGWLNDNGGARPSNFKIKVDLTVLDGVFASDVPREAAVPGQMGFVATVKLDLRPHKICVLAVDQPNSPEKCSEPFTPL